MEIIQLIAESYSQKKNMHLLLLELSKCYSSFTLYPELQEISTFPKYLNKSVKFSYIYHSLFFLTEY